jgi:hypothetical protein
MRKLPIADCKTSPGSCHPLVRNLVTILAMVVERIRRPRLHGLLTNTIEWNRKLGRRGRLRSQHHRLSLGTKGRRTNIRTRKFGNWHLAIGNAVDKKGACLPEYWSDALHTNATTNFHCAPPLPDVCNSRLRTVTRLR